MKKILAIVLAVILVVSAGALAFAQGGFVSSPSGNSAPTIIDIIYEEDSCMPRVVITPYSEREDLEEDAESDMDEAYKEIYSNEDLTKIFPGLKEVSVKLGKNAAYFAVSDLFDISVHHNLPHNFCGVITIKLRAETLKNFVALMHRDKNGNWEMIQDAVVNYEDSTLSFTARDFSPFAIVVDTSAQPLPDTGGEIIIPAIVMAVSAVSLAGVLFSLKKKKNEA